MGITKKVPYLSTPLCILGIKLSGVFSDFIFSYDSSFFSPFAICLLPKHIGAKQLTLEDPQMTMSHPYTMTTPYTSLPAQVWWRT